MQMLFMPVYERDVKNSQAFHLPQGLGHIPRAKNKILIKPLRNIK